MTTKLPTNAIRDCLNAYDRMWKTIAARLASAILAHSLGASNATWCELNDSVVAFESTLAQEKS